MFQHIHIQQQSLQNTTLAASPAESSSSGEAPVATPSLEEQFIEETADMGEDSEEP